MSDSSNQVLNDDARTSSNFFESDQILQHYLNKHCSGSALEYMTDKLSQLGELAAQTMDDLSLTADKQPPTLKKRTPLGEHLDKVKFHPAYHTLLDIAAKSEMFYVKYDPKLSNNFPRERNRLSFAAGQLYAMSELGVYCPLCMTDGAAHLVQKYASDEIKDRLLEKLSARTGEELYTGAMFLTEKSGGSDVGRNLATAEQIEGNRYKLNGEKWFCSNVNAEVILALARTGNPEDGTRGLSLFLVEKHLPDGTRNSMNIIRLKDKLGVRSMATGEVQFDNTIGIRLGEENNGFKLMAEMINISRTYNAVAAIAGSRRAIIEAWQYLNHRTIFDKTATRHAMIRQKFYELNALFAADFLLVWRAIRAMDGASEGKEVDQHLMRMLVPMAKWRSAEHSVYIARECMELMGGNGYIEDFVMPKLFRDVNVLPIWEGSGNIIVLDMLRAAKKSEGLKLVLQEIEQTDWQSVEYGDQLQRRADKVTSALQSLEQLGNRDTIEASAKPIFEELIKVYQMALMVEERDEENRSWYDPALRYFASTLESNLEIRDPVDYNTVKDAIAWNY